MLSSKEISVGVSKRDQGLGLWSSTPDPEGGGELAVQGWASLLPVRFFKSDL